MAVTMCGCKSAEDRKGRCVDPQTSYAGAVLATGEHNILDDSYFYALVWDGSRVVEVEYGATAWWSYHNGAQVDATDDVRAAALEWYRPMWEASEVATQDAHLARLRRGVRVRSTTSRGKNVGVEGEAFWVGDGYARGSVRVGVRVEGESEPRWLDGARVEVVGADTVDPEMTALRWVESESVHPYWNRAAQLGLTHEQRREP
jgi:hypothetical protein